MAVSFSFQPLPDARWCRQLGDELRAAYRGAGLEAAWGRLELYFYARGVGIGGLQSEQLQQLTQLLAVSVRVTNRRAARLNQLEREGQLRSARASGCGSRQRRASRPRGR